MILIKVGFALLWMGVRSRLVVGKPGNALVHQPHWIGSASRVSALARGCMSCRSSSSICEQQNMNACHVQMNERMHCMVIQPIT